ncbi:exodeoxyribonuclease V subunit gamma [Guyparkeria sp.]|uniref:exodeoxyribonuclease V subunit gamma n=1 Tax=Guyparkeria sp. TaxID=2035736 RepID=UPI0039710039
MNHSSPSVSSIQPGFIVLQGNRLEGLRDLLVEWLDRYPLAPLEDETILVQSNGMAQWLRLALGRDRTERGLGVATALDLLLPARLQWRCYRAVMGTEPVPAEAPLDKPRLTWRLLRILRDQARSESVFGPLTHYIEDDEHRAYQLAARLADQFDQYQVYRADWLGDWAAGAEVLADALGRQRDPIPSELQWQPALWRAVLDDLDVKPPRTETGEPAAGYAGRALIHRRFLEMTEALTERPAGLPRRIVVFGVSALPPQVLEVLGAVSRWVQVIFCLQNPCQHYWGDIVEDRHLFRHEYRRITERKIDGRLDEHDLHQHAHPLLASWGKQGRDLVRLVDEFDQAPERVGGRALNIDVFDPPGPGHLLARLQTDILDLVPMHEIEAERRRLEDDDQSIAFTVAHSPLREVEILQDQLLDAFDRDPTLQPRDIIVMVPDMADYAPAINAVFGRLEPADPRHLPFAISDRPEREEHPMARALDWLLALPDSRLTASEVLDLLEVAALRARFGISADDVSLLRHWIENAGIRWGLDAEHREQFCLPAGIEQNAWRFGLDRLLYAYLAGAEDDWGGIVPVGGMDAASAEAIGKLHALLESLKHWRERLGQARTPEQWRECLGDLLATFFAPEAIPPIEEGVTDARGGASGRNPLAERESAVSLRDRLDSALNGWLDDCASAAFDLPVTLETARSAWLDRLDEHRLSQRFLVGAVNFATLMPMRAIPFRQVYLLGMDDRSYPRRQPPADFDLMAGRYRPGDRSRREDDRYLFLEALLSARDRLWISWVGRDIRDNHEEPASVLVNQLRDHIDRGWRVDGETTASEHLTTEHPLQPFSRRYFSDASPGLYSYATEWHRVHCPNPDRASTSGADAHGEPHHGATVKVATDDQSLRCPSLADLALALKKPWRVWLGEFLAIPARRETAAPEDDEPFELDNLGGHQLSARLLEQVLERLNREPVDIIDPDILETRLPEAIDAAFARIAGAGQLPVHPFDQTLRQEHGEALSRQLRTWAALQARYPDTVEPFRPGDRLVDDPSETADLTGEINDVRSGPEGAVRLRLIAGPLHKGKKLKWHRLVGEWPYHVAAQLGGRPVTTYLVSESDARSAELTGRPTVMEPLDADEARRILRQLIEHWHRATTEPVPAEPRAQIAWVIETGENERLEAARDAFETAAQYEPDLVRLWPDFRMLADDPAFREIAEGLYRPLTRHTLGRHREPSEKGQRA